MKHYTDPISRITYNFKEEEVISVYLRKANGKKRLVFSSRSPQKSFNFYHTVKIFKNDRKYLFVTIDNKLVQLLADSGTDQKPLIRRKVTTVDSDYHNVNIPGIHKVPKTLIDQLNKLLKSQSMPDDGRKITRNKLIPMLLAYYVSLTNDERTAFNENSYQEYVKQKIKSGSNIVTKTYDKEEEIYLNENDTDLL